MTQKELLVKITELKELEVMQEEIAAQMEALKDEIKAEMTVQGVDKLLIGTFKVSYTKYTTSRFDSKAFKLTHEELYKQYTKNVEATRFSIA